jgi:hypothetical protein
MIFTVSTFRHGKCSSISNDYGMSLARLEDGVRSDCSDNDYSYSIIKDYYSHSWMSNTFWNEWQLFTKLSRNSGLDGQEPYRNRHYSVSGYRT